MKCEICHNADAQVAIEKDDEELYVCKSCAEKERVSRQKRSQRTRKISRDGVEMTVTEISSDGDAPPSIVKAIMNAFDGMLSGIEKAAEDAKKEKEADNLHLFTTQNITPELNFQLLYERFGGEGMLGAVVVDDFLFKPADELFPQGAFDHAEMQGKQVPGLGIHGQTVAVEVFLRPMGADLGIQVAVIRGAVGFAEDVAEFCHQRGIVGVVADGDVALVGDVVIEPVAVSGIRAVKTVGLLNIIHIFAHR